MRERSFDVPRYLSGLPLFNDLCPDELKHVPDAVFAMMISSPRGTHAHIHPDLSERVTAIRQHAQSLGLTAAPAKAAFGRRRAARQLT